MMLKKFSKIYLRGYQFLGGKIFPYSASPHKRICGESTSSKSSTGSERHVGFKSTFYEKDGSSDIIFAENIAFKMLQRSRPSSNRRINNLLDSCSKHDRKYRASIGERFYLWWSGVFATTGVLVCQRWFSREDYSAKASHWLNPQTIQQALKLYFVGDPRDRLLLSVKATEDGANFTSQKKGSIDRAAQEFKAKTEACTASMLNKIGLQLITSNQQSQAVELFRTASEAGHISAVFNMGLCFELGRGVPKDIDKAVEYYKIAASNGHGKSQFNLATLYLHGTLGVKKNESKAVELLSQAADNGIAKAQVYLGLHFAKQNNQNDSAKYFALASDQQDPVGMYHYAVCLENGWGVQKDMKKAGKLYKEAAEMGYVSAMFNTAVYYENGFGDFTQSRRLAMDWYTKAADCGDEEARKKFNELLAKPRESKNIMHPILRDILTFGLFHKQPKQEKDFHRSRSAPNLGEIRNKLNTSNLLSQLKKPCDIEEDSSDSLSCSLSMSNGISSASSYSFGLF